MYVTTMLRGRNYVKNNKGVCLQQTRRKKKKTPSSSMVPCTYGAACTRPKCIYWHDPSASATQTVSSDPCMAFLAKKCTFGKKCLKRHPGPDESERLLAKYSGIMCRFGDECLTKGCLYRHEMAEEEEPYFEPNYILPENTRQQQTREPSSYFSPHAPAVRRTMYPENDDDEYTQELSQTSTYTDDKTLLTHQSHLELELHTNYESNDSSSAVQWMEPTPQEQTSSYVDTSTTNAFGITEMDISVAAMTGELRAGAREFIPGA